MFLFILGSVKTDATEMLSCLFFIYCFLSGTLSQNVLSSKESPEGSCGRLCSCTEKDNMLYVNCEEKNIDSIAKIKLPPARPFHLNLYKNDLVELLPEGLIGLKNAHSLNLGGNSIQQLEPGVFHALSFLKKLYINKNFLVALKEDTFLGLVNLEYLQADTNFIEVIEHGTFNRLIHLKVLILNDNSIRVLPRNIFRFVPLTHLDLRGNQLQSLPYVGFLEHIGRIVELLLEDNKWLCDCEMLLLKIWRDTMVTQSSVSEVVCDSPANLKDHSLSNIMKDDLCPTYGDTSLEESSKSLNMVATPSSKILKLVIASDDAIFTTPTPVLTSDVACVELCSCLISSTAGFLIHCEDKGIKRMSELGFLHQSPTDLVLTGNMIQRLLRDDFVAYESLVLLNLANNKIDYIENQSFLCLGLLQKLNLNGNRIDQLFSGMFFGLNSLEQLYLEYNVIEGIHPGSFSALPNLKILSLNGNLLHKLPPYIFHHLPLIKVNLMNNAFKHLPVMNVLDQLIALRQIFLDDNPWDCTCDLVDFKQWVETLQKYSVSGSILCQTPNKIAKTKLEIVSQEVMCPDLVTFLPMPTGTFAHGVPFPSTTIKSTGFYHHFTVSVPFSVFIVIFLIFLLIVVFSASGIVFLIVHRKQRSKKKHREDRPQDGGPVDVKHGMSAQKNCCPLTERKTENIKQDPTYSPAATDWYNHDCHTHSKYQGKEDRSQNHQEEIELLSRSLVYAAPRGVVLDWTKNEHFELKGNSQTDPEYLEIINHHNHHLQ
ncbi:SLIT and NTRK-like protein 6 isoform X3 [Paramormyrops kingsleyae]|uniref:SLIT and NTRK-like family, member 6 n=1 Tax=Paramormyrops kingsleyae TaxID=1676925 RepID=A0A3B3RXQ3_9TELE|nr:SLIT and NTRK-like protein 6 isoform X1 [Paramormyrops kingsleyae]XP_023648842.1 SLIT and NTRK-like protein 6 isoform X1 [Paramormyrops kingsleyae]